MDKYQPEIGDIVLFRNDDGSQTPSIVVQVVSPTEVQLYHFGIGGSGGTHDVYSRGDSAGQWQPKPENKTTPKQA